MLFDIVEKLSVDLEAYNKLPWKAAGRTLMQAQIKFYNNNNDKNIKLLFVDSIIEMWKMQGQILHAKSELIAIKKLKK